MWGFGGRYYWGRKERGKTGDGNGIAVIFAWMSSQERHLNNYVDLYSSLGWNSIVCHSQFFNMFFPEKATPLAFDILNELVVELKARPCPVVFVAFSGGPKACMHAVLQIIEGKCEAQCNQDDYQLVRGCISGYIYDSSPVDFTSDVGARFVLQLAVLKMSHSRRVMSWVANGIASGLDALFLNRFESQRSEYWQTLYSSASMGAPYLILCSENDDLAPFQTICNFAQRLQELGANVKLIKWQGSSHVGHYRIYPIDYKAAVTELLGKAAQVFQQKMQQLEGDGRRASVGKKDGISSSMLSAREAAARSSQSSGGLPFKTSNPCFSSSSTEYWEGTHVGSLRDEGEEALIHLGTPPHVSAHGVLGQVLFDACVPKNVEGWELTRPQGYLIGSPFTNAPKHKPFNPIKRIWRSRL